VEADHVAAASFLDPRREIERCRPTEGDHGVRGFRGAADAEQG
jgi:hypothetical protein